MAVFISVLAIITALHLIAFVFAIGAEHRRSKATVVLGKYDQRSYCVYTTDASTVYGMSAFVLLLISHVLVNGVTRCLCCGKGLVRGTSSACAKFFFVFSWYPIYRIQTGLTLKDLDASFLTYHCLHSPLGGAAGAQALVVTPPSERDGVPRMSLPVFGLASYKLKGSLWTPNGGCERQLANSLSQAADNWLRLLQVNHPDFVFFSSR